MKRVGRNMNSITYRLFAVATALNPEIASVVASAETVIFDPFNDMVGVTDISLNSIGNPFLMW